MSINETKGSSPMTDQTLGQFDPKVVNTVRYLQKLPSSNSHNGEADTVPTENLGVSPNFPSSKEESKKERKESEESEESKKPKGHKDTNRKYSLKDLGNSLNKMRISINGDNKDEIRKIKTKHQSIKELTRVSFTKTNIFKTKSEFHKKLMSDTNISKYKQQCIQLLKDDEDLKMSYGKFSFFTHEKFLDDILFKDKIFLYKLESMLKTETNKNKREYFFKNEMKKALNIILLEEEYNKRIETLNSNFNDHIERISNFKFMINVDDK